MGSLLILTWFATGSLPDCNTEAETVGGVRPPYDGHTRVCGGYTRPFAEATRSSSRGLTLDYVNGIQARKSHKSVNCMQLNGIRRRVGLIHNVNALHRRLAIHAFAWATHNRLGITRTKTSVKKET